MPLTGFRCPPTVATAGQEHPFDYCITECPRQCMPTAVLNAIALDHADNPHKGSMLSATSLQGCKRKLFLERTEPYYEEPRKLYYAVRGSLIHGFLEPGESLAGITSEKRLFKTLEGGPWGHIEISGQVDWYDANRRKLEDFKTISDKGLYILYNYGYKDEHEIQLNIYRWLMDGGHYGSLTGPQVFWPVEEMQLHYLLMNRVISTGGLVTDEFTGFRSPGKFKLETKRKAAGETANGAKKWHVTFNIPKVPIWTFAEVEDYIRKMGPSAMRAFEEEGFMPPGVMHSKEDRWQCDYCGVAKRCAEIEVEQGKVVPIDRG